MRGPGSRAGTDHPTGEALLDAGLKVAAGKGLAAVSVAEVTTEAGLAKGTFYVHFSGRDDFLVIMHRRTFDDVARRISRRCRGVGSGYPRLALGFTEFLELCLRQRAIRCLLLQSRTEPALEREMTDRLAQASALVETELGAAGANVMTLEISTLLVAAAVEVASLETAAGQRLARHRAALLALTRSSGSRSSGAAPRSAHP